MDDSFEPQYEPFFQFQWNGRPLFTIKTPLPLIALLAVAVVVYVLWRY